MKSNVAINTNPNDVPKSRGCRNNTAARSRGVGDEVQRELTICSVDMGRTADGQTRRDFRKIGQMLETQSERCHSFLSELQRIHVPAHGISRNEFSNL